MRNKRTRGKSFPYFWVIYIVFVLILAAGCFAVYSYVYDSLVLYENAQPENYISESLRGFDKDSPIAVFAEKEIFFDNGLSAYDDAELARQDFYELLQNNEISFEKDKTVYDAQAPVYKFFSDGEEFMTVALSPLNTETRLGIMTFSDWEINNAELYMGGGSGKPQDDLSYSCKITAPSLYTVYINGKPIEDGYTEIQSIEEFSAVSQYTEVPKMVTFDISGLRFDPKVEITNNLGEKADFISNDGCISLPALFLPSEEASALAETVQVLEKAKTWSKFLTNDIGGARHGVAKVQEFLIADSYLSKMADAFSRGIDITFVSPHTITGFTGEKVTNCIKYSDSFFSCDVYFEKNMKIEGIRDIRVDIFNSRMYFVNISDGESSAWYLADMQSIVGEGLEN